MSERDRLTSSVFALTACILDAQPGFSSPRSTHDPRAFHNALRFAPSEKDRAEVIRRASILAIHVMEEHGGALPLVLPIHLSPLPEDVATLYALHSSEAA